MVGASPWHPRTRQLNRSLAVGQYPPHPEEGLEAGGATAPLLGASQPSATALGGGAHRTHRAGEERPSTSARRTRSAHQSVIDWLVDGKGSHQARQDRRATAPFLGAGRVSAAAFGGGAHRLHLGQVEAHGIPFVILEERHVIVYVDAYFKKGNSRGEGHTYFDTARRMLDGLVVLVIDDQGKYYAFACTIRADFWDSLAPRKNKILPAELITPPCVAHTAPHLLKCRRVIIFGDNLGGSLLHLQGQPPRVGSPMHHLDHPPQVR